MPPRVPFSFRGPSGYFAAMRGVHPAGFPYVEPVELAWGLAAPLVGRDPEPLAGQIEAVPTTDASDRILRAIDPHRRGDLSRSIGGETKDDDLIRM